MIPSPRIKTSCHF